MRSRNSSMVLHRKIRRRPRLSVNYESIFYVDMEEEKIRPYRLSGRTVLVHPAAAQDDLGGTVLPAHIDKTDLQVLHRAVLHHPVIEVKGQVTT